MIKKNNNIHAYKYIQYSLPPTILAQDLGEELGLQSFSENQQGESHRPPTPQRRGPRE